MGTCEENVVQLRPNFRVTNASALWPLGEAGSQGGAVWVVVRTRLERNMWKHSRSTYLGGTRLSHSQLATAPLWGEGSFVCVIMMKWFLRTTAVVGNTCDRAHFYKGIYFHFRMCKRICLIFFFNLLYFINFESSHGMENYHSWPSRRRRSVVPHGPLQWYIPQLWTTRHEVRNLDAASRLCLPTVLFHRFTANRRLQVTVTTAGMVRWGRVFAATWVTGELDGNFKTMMTSCCSWSLNMRGLWRRRRRKIQ